MKNYNFSLLLAILLAVLIPNSVFAFGIGLTPSTIEMEARPGSHHRQILKVRNFNPDKAVRLTVSVADWTLDEQGQVMLLPPEENDRSASAWVNFSPSVLLLQPNTTQQVIVDIYTPLALDKSGDHRTAIILSTVLPSKQARDGKNGVWNRYQMTSLFYANVLPGSSKPKITEALIEPNDAKAEHVLNIRIDNSGIRHSRLQGTVALQRDKQDPVAIQSFESVILNNQARSFAIKLNSADLEPGEYKVIFDIKDEGKLVPLALSDSPVLIIR